MSYEQRKGMPLAAKIFAGLFLAVFLLYLPLGLIVLEYKLASTRHLERSLRKLGLADAVEFLYQPIVDWFQ